MVCEVCPKPLSNVVSREEYVGWIGVSELCPTLHQQGCILTVSRGHYLVVPASSMKCVIPQLLSLELMILHVTYVLLHYRLMIFYMIVDVLSFA